MFVYANLDDAKMGKLQEFERKRGMHVVALADVALEPAPVDEDLVDDIRKLEDELGVCLLAVH